jgi:hypothetical protein
MARLDWISHGLQLARFLAALQDSSNELQQLSGVLRDNTVCRGFPLCSLLCRQSIISAITAPCLEVRLRVAQISIQKGCGTGAARIAKEFGSLETSKTRSTWATLGTEFSNVRDDQGEVSAASNYHGHGIVGWAQTLS